MPNAKMPTIRITKELADTIDALKDGVSRVTGIPRPTREQTAAFLLQEAVEIWNTGYFTAAKGAKGAKGAKIVKGKLTRASR